MLALRMYTNFFIASICSNASPFYKDLIACLSGVTKIQGLGFEILCFFIDISFFLSSCQNSILSKVNFFLGLKAIDTASRRGDKVPLACRGGTVICEVACLYSSPRDEEPLVDSPVNRSRGQVLSLGDSGKLVLVNAIGRLLVCDISTR